MRSAFGAVRGSELSWHPQASKAARVANVREESTPWVRVGRRLGLAKPIGGPLRTSTSEGSAYDCVCRERTLWRHGAPFFRGLAIPCAKFDVPEFPDPKDKGQPALLRLLLGLILLAGLEAGHVPSAHWLAQPGVLLTSWLLAFVYALVVLLPIWGFFVHYEWVADVRGSHMRLVAVLWVPGLCFLALAQEPALAVYPLMWLLYAGFGIYLWLALWVSMEAAALPRRWLVPARLVARYGSLIACGLLYFLNYRLYVQEYPGLHLSVTMLVYALFALGTQGVRLPGHLRTRMALGLGVLLLVTGLSSASGDNWARSQRAFEAYSILGQSTVLYSDALDLEGADDSESLDSPNGQASEFALPIDDAWQVFLGHAGLPALPDDFSLERYNVLLITVEAMRFDQTSMGRPQLDLTPRLAAFAASPGVASFTRAYAPSSGTLQSMSAVMTMSYPTSAPLSLRKKSWTGRLRDEAKTVAEAFSKAGYGTFMASHDYRHAFSSFLLGLSQGFGTRSFAVCESETVDPDSQVLNDARAHLQRFSDDQRPFFGWVFFAGPHSDYFAHYEDMPAGEDLDLYRQELRFVDEKIGELLNFVEHSPSGAKTIVIITGDHGEEFEEHGGKRHKNTVYEESVHVPLVIRVPGSKGGVYTDPSSTLYVFPWLLERASDDLRKAASRRVADTLAPMMKATNGAVIVESLGRKRMQTALIYEERKLIYRFLPDLIEYYDLDNDPGEQSDLAPSSPFDLEARSAALTRYRKLRRANKQFTLERKKKKKHKKKAE